MPPPALIDLARSSPRDGFVSSVTSLLLLIEPSGPAEAAEFRTEVKPRRSAAPISGGGQEVLALVKAAKNPFPEYIFIGRSRNCDVVVRHPSVSKLHARLSGGEGSLGIEDLGSQNGTRLNGDDLRPHTLAAVQLGDRIEFGEVTGILLDAGSLHDRLHRRRGG